MKALASRQALAALQAERARAPAPVGDARRDHDQPAIFRGTLKGYQLKGMNWLANLYDQVRYWALFAWELTDSY